MSVANPRKVCLINKDSNENVRPGVALFDHLVGTEQDRGR
jgi:hypothetical protein